MDNQLIGRKGKALLLNLKKCQREFSKYVSILSSQGGERWERTVSAKKTFDKFSDVILELDPPRNAPQPTPEPKEPAKEEKESEDKAEKSGDGKSKGKRK